MHFACLEKVMTWSQTYLSIIDLIGSHLFVVVLRVLMLHTQSMLGDSQPMLNVLSMLSKFQSMLSMLSEFIPMLREFEYCKR